MADSKMADNSSDKNAALAAFYWLKLHKMKTLSNGLGLFLDTAEVIQLKFHSMAFVQNWQTWRQITRFRRRQPAARALRS